MDEQEMAAPAETVEAAPPETAPVVEALPEPQPEAQPGEEPVSAPEEAKAAPPAPLDLLLDRVETRLAALEAIAHSGHNLDASAVDQIVALVWARINESISKRLG